MQLYYLKRGALLEAAEKLCSGGPDDIACPLRPEWTAAGKPRILSFLPTERINESVKKNESFMSRVANFIVKRRAIILALFLVLSLVSCYTVTLITVEEDIAKYLPDDSEAKQGIEKMSGFVTYGTAEIMVDNISLEEAKAIDEKLEEIEDVYMVTFDETEEHYKDGNALFSLRLDVNEEDEKAEQALENIRALLADYEVYIDTEIGYSMSETIIAQIMLVMVFVAIVVLAVLLLVSSSYAEIPMMILVFGVSALINKGTDFLMGDLSFVSNSVAIVLQLALSLDYAIILVNHYKEERETYPAGEAATRALTVAIPEILASCLTTIAGLVAMTFMNFCLGYDLGMELIKAIFCSILTVFFFMPCVLVLFSKAMDKTKHRSLLPKVDFLGKFAYATRFIMPVIAVVLIVLGAFGNQNVKFAYFQGMCDTLKKDDLTIAQEHVKECFGENVFTALVYPAGDYTSEQEMVRKLEECDEIKSVLAISTVEAKDGYLLGDDISYEDFMELAEVDETTAKAVMAYTAAGLGETKEYLNDNTAYEAPLVEVFDGLYELAHSGEVEMEQDKLDTIDDLYDQLSYATEQLQLGDVARCLVYLNLPVQSDETFAFLDTMHIICDEYYDEVYIVGNPTQAKAFYDSYSIDNRLVSILSIVMVLLILFFTFKSLGMPLVLILIIQGSIWINFTISWLLDDWIFFMVQLIVSSIQMGANIDYAIVVSTRFREVRTRMDPKEAVIDTMNFALPTVLTSGLAMIGSGIFILFFVSQCIISGIGKYLAIGTTITLTLVLFFLPQLLLLGEKFIEMTTVKFTLFSRLKNRVGRRIIAGALACASILTAVMVPSVLKEHRTDLQQKRNSTSQLLTEVEELWDIAEELEYAEESYKSLKYEYATQAVTEQIGSEQISEGEEAYQEGLQQYADGKAEYESGSEQLEDAKEQYEAGKTSYEEGKEEYTSGLKAYEEGQKQLEEGQAAYDSGLEAYNEGRAQADAAKEQLAEGQAQYDEGLAEYNAAKAQYDAAKAQLEEGQAAYDAGLAEYNEGKAAYEAAEKQLAEGQAAYDAGLKQYNAGKEQYNESKEELESVTPLYESLQPFMEQLEENTAEMEAMGGLFSEAVKATHKSIQKSIAALLSGTGYSTVDEVLEAYEDAQSQLADAEDQLADAEITLSDSKQQLEDGQTQLNAAKKQLDAAEEELAEGKAQLDEGYAQLAEAEPQLEAAEEQLAAAKKELNSGYAQLDDAEDQLSDAKQQLSSGKKELESGYAAASEAEKQLADGKKQLDSGKEELDSAETAIQEGEDQLSDAKEQLDSGKEELDSAAEQLREGQSQLDENRSELEESLELLDSYTEDKEKLADGLVLLAETEGVKDMIEDEATASDILSTASRYLTTELENNEKEMQRARIYAMMLLIAAILALGAVVLLLLTGPSMASVFLAGIATLGALASGLLWNSLYGSFLTTIVLCALALVVFAALFVAVFTSMLHRHGAIWWTKSAVAAETTASAEEAAVVEDTVSADTLPEVLPETESVSEPAPAEVAAEVAPVVAVSATEPAHEKPAGVPTADVPVAKAEESAPAEAPVASATGEAGKHPMTPAVRKIMNNLGIDCEKAMNLLGIPEEERSLIKAEVERHPMTPAVRKIMNNVGIDCEKAMNLLEIPEEERKIIRAELKR